MKTIRLAAMAAALLLAAGVVPAQPGAGPGASPGANAPHGPGGPGRMGGPWGSDYTSGWSMMTPQEREEHWAKLRSMTTPAECRAYMDQHHQQMLERAKQKGVGMPMRPRHDVCARLNG